MQRIYAGSTSKTAHKFANVSNAGILLPDRYCPMVGAILGSAEDTFIKHYCALPAPEQRYLRIIARGIADAYQSNKTK